MVQLNTLVAAAALSVISVHGLDLTVTSIDSIKSASSAIASGMVSFYHGNESGHVPGLLDAPYFWWEGGAMFDTLIQYWHLTGDSQYNALISEGIQFQKGPNGDFMPANQSAAEGNDDQGVWALAAMSAAESQFPEAKNGTTWFALADAVFNEQVARWDTKTCGGGLRWQIFPFNNGFDYKQSLSNGEFFQLSSRLARYTGNSTYSDWASEIFTWTTTVGLIDANWNVYDGAHVSTNCTDISRIQFSNAAGTFISGAAHMFNLTSGSSQWKTTLDGLLNQTLSLFFPDGIASEIACESRQTCNTDMKAYKGLLTHWLVDTIQLAPYTSSSILPLLTSSAEAAAKACGSGNACTLAWNGTPTTKRDLLSANESTVDTGNSTGGLGEQLSALSAVQALLVPGAASPVTEKTGGSNATSTSTGGGGAGNGTETANGSGTPSPTKNAALVTRGETGLLAGVLGLMAWIML